MGQTKHTAWKQGRRWLSVLLSLAMLASVVAISGLVQANATLFVDPAPPISNVFFYAPETIYAQPTGTGINAQGTTQYFANNWTSTSSGAGWGPLGTGEETNGYIHFYCAGATDISIVMETVDVATGYNPPLAGSGTGGNYNVTLGQGRAVARSGLVRWKATFTVAGVTYVSYCYSYVYLPNADFISGAAACVREGISGTNYPYDTGLFIVGSHSQDPSYGSTSATSGTGTSQTGGSGFYGTSANLKRDLWNRAYASGNTTFLTDGTNTPNYLATGGSKVVYSRNWRGVGDTSYQETASANGGRGYIQVDNSRYSALAQVPQLRMYYVRTRVHGTGSIQYGYDANSSTGVWGGGGSLTNGTFLFNGNAVANGQMGVLGNPITLAGAGFMWSGALANTTFSTTNQSTTNGTFTARAGYHWRATTGSGLTYQAVASGTRCTTYLNYTTRYKGNLRAMLQEEIRSGIQYETMRNWPAYRDALEKLAEALCNPTFSFRNPTTGYDTGDIDLGDEGVGGSLANNVYNRRMNLSVLGPYPAKATYRSSVNNSLLFNDTDNGLPYYLGESVYARYNQNLQIPGYRPVPIAVSVPGSIAPNSLPGYPQGGTDPSFASSSKFLFKDFETGGQAPKHKDYAINVNTKVTSALESILWMEPIQYRIIYQQGDPMASIPNPTLHSQSLTYDQEARLINNPYIARPGYEFVGWEFRGGLHKADPLDANYSTTHFVRPFSNLTTVDGDTIYAVAIWKKTVAASHDLYVDYNGGYDVTEAVPTSTNKIIPSSSDMQYGNHTEELPTLARDGYTFDGWYFDLDTWLKRFDTYQFTFVNPDMPGLTIFAKWKPIESRIFYDKNFANEVGNSGGNPPSVLVKYGDTVTLNAGTGLVRSGYTLVGWAVNAWIEPSVKPVTTGVKVLNLGGTYRYDELFDMTPPPQPDEITLVGIWKANVYTVKFDINWHDLDPSFESAPLNTLYAEHTKVYNTAYGLSFNPGPDLPGVPSGTKAEWPEPNPSRFGWTFVGWFGDDSESDPITKTSIFKPSPTDLATTPYTKTVYARWIKGDAKLFDTILIVGDDQFGLDVKFPDNSLAISVDAADNMGTVFARGQGTKTNLNAYRPTKPGYEFIRWEYDTSPIDDRDPALDAGAKVPSLLKDVVGGQELLINYHTRLVAVWRPITYTVIYHSQYPGATPPADIEDCVYEVNFLGYPDPATVRLANPEFTLTGWTMTGYGYDTVVNTLNPSLFFGKTEQTLSALLAGQDAAGRSGQTLSGAPVIHIYAQWRLMGGIPDPPPGDDDDDLPDVPKPPIDEDDPDSGEDMIVMYLVAPTDVFVTPVPPTRYYLEYGSEYPTLPIAQKTDGRFVGWFVMKYGSNGAKTEADGGLLGREITNSKIVDHEQSIWVYPKFDPGFVVRYVGNGGSIGGLDSTNRVVFLGDTYGNGRLTGDGPIVGMPVPDDRGETYKFLGWFTLPDGGFEVTDGTFMGTDGKPIPQGQLVPVDEIPIIDTLFAQWEKTTTCIEDIVNDVKGWLSSDSLMHLPNWASLTLLGIGLPMLGITAGTFASLSTGVIFLASLLGLLFFPLALMLPFLFPVIGALMPVWWPLLIIL